MRDPACDDPEVISAASSSPSLLLRTLPDMPICTQVGVVPLNAPPPAGNQQNAPESASGGGGGGSSNTNDQTATIAGVCVGVGLALAIGGGCAFVILRR